MAHGYEGDFDVPVGVALGTPSGSMGELHPSHTILKLDQMCAFVCFLCLHSCLDDDGTSLRQQKLEKQVGDQFGDSGIFMLVFLIKCD